MVRRIVLLAMVVLLLGAAAVALILRNEASPPSGSDPSGEVLRGLSTVSDAVPPGSSQVSTSKRDAVWSTACPGSGGENGWSPVLDITTFRSALSQPALVSEVGDALAKAGWMASTPRDDAAWQYTPVAEWAKRVRGASSAVAVVFAYPPAPVHGAGNWMLGAEGKTSGFALPGC